MSMRTCTSAHVRQGSQHERGAHRHLQGTSPPRFQGTREGQVAGEGLHRLIVVLCSVFLHNKNANLHCSLSVAYGTGTTIGL